MIRLTYSLEIITPCFLGGATPDSSAEIRPPSIRGQLRWWFRVLGGFKSLAEKGLSLRQQEELIFGAAADNDTQAGLLTVRTHGLAPSDDVRDDTGMRASVYDDRRYFLFPLRTERDGTRHSRAVFNADIAAKSPMFNLTLIWRGQPSLKDDVAKLVQVFAELGSLGFRGRRAMGALAIRNSSISLDAALDAFTNRAAIDIRSLPCNDDGSHSIDVLARWLKRWKAHGRSGDHAGNTTNTQLPPLNVGFEWALRDHDEGYGVAGGIPTGAPRTHGKTPKGSSGDTYRPALGLPVVQGTSRGKVFWYPEHNPAKAHGNPNYRGEGRFASPVILRPHKNSSGWRALVIFVDAKQWNPNDPVYLNGTSKSVSLDLYNQMKADSQLQSFPSPP